MLGHLQVAATQTTHKTSFFPLPFLRVIPVHVNRFIALSRRTEGRLTFETGAKKVTAPRGEEVDRSIDRRYYVWTGQARTALPAAASKKKHGGTHALSRPVPSRRHQEKRARTPVHGFRPIRPTGLGSRRRWNSFHFGSKAADLLFYFI